MSTVKGSEERMITPAGLGDLGEELPWVVVQAVHCLRVPTKESAVFWPQTLTLEKTQGDPTSYHHYPLLRQAG